MIQVLVARRAIRQTTPREWRIHSDITNEELEYLRDIAEREAVNRFTTAEIQVNFGGINNNVSSNMDLDGIVNYYRRRCI